MVCFAAVFASSPSFAATRKQVIVPEEDRFSPFELTVRVGDSVTWQNSDTDDHTVVSLDSANTTGPRRVDVLLRGTDNNGGKPGKHTIKFTQAGTFTYYCRFHAQLNDHRQPIAPGPYGGIKDVNGNYGTPMMGIITVK